jgi:guanine nucleotide-binding protein subunit beta-2-like 1 protein
MDWVTSIVTAAKGQDKSDLVVSASRDKSIIIWAFTESNTDEFSGFPKKALTGHSHFITDLAISNEGKYLLSASWDHDIRLWDLEPKENKTEISSKRFVGNEKEVFTVAFSPDNR